jgi:hypothetical protein
MTPPKTKKKFSGSKNVNVIQLQSSCYFKQKLSLNPQYSQKPQVATSMILSTDGYRVLKGSIFKVQSLTTYERVISILFQLIIMNHR